MAKGHKHTKLWEWQQWEKSANAECAKCGRKDHLTVDHIIPIAILELLCVPREERDEDEENFQWLCRWCNKLKGFSLDHLNPKTVPLLKKYVEQYEKDVTL